MGRLQLRLTFITVLLLAIAPGSSAPARAQGAAHADGKPGEASYYTTRGVLAEFFPASERVTYRTFALAPV